MYRKEGEQETEVACRAGAAGHLRNMIATLQRATRCNNLSR